MSGFHVVEPEVAGALGDRTEMDSSIHPPIVKRLHYEFQGWLGDGLVTSFPCYLVADPLRKAIEGSGATGVSFENAEVSAEEQFVEFEPEIANNLPRFWWLKVTGVAGKDDFGMLGNADLVVSARGLTLLKEHVLENATVRPYESA